MWAIKQKTIFTILVCLLAIVCMAAGKTIYVDADAIGANNGSSWANAYRYLQNALADANSAAKPIEIRVAQGIYTPDQGVGKTPGDRNATFQLINDVAMKGGYAGFGAPNPDARDIEAYDTILSGDLDGNDVDVNDPCDLPSELTRAENSYHVVTGSRTDTTALLDGFIITGGNDDRYECIDPCDPETCTPIGYGAGMYNYNGSPTVINCTFRWNSAFKSGLHIPGGFGGGLYNDSNSSPALTNCTFSENYAHGGSGIYNYNQSSPILTKCSFNGNSANWVGGGLLNGGDSNPILTDCTFNGNSARYGGGGASCISRSILTLINCTLSGNIASNGGAMYNEYGGYSVLTQCLFNGNQAQYRGGGIYNFESSLTLSGCDFNANSAPKGGAMYNEAGSPGIENCQFNGNLATTGGGAMYNTASGGRTAAPTMTNCTFCGNSALNGGTVYNTSRTEATTGPTLKNCLVINNSATNNGGAIYNYPDTTDATTNLTAVNCTFNGNSAASGGGMYNKGRSSPLHTVVKVTNCILWGDIPDETCNDDYTTVSIVYSDIQGGWPHYTNINIDPCFADPEKGDYHLQSTAGRWDPNSQTWVKDVNTSPCIDTGHPAFDWTAELWPHGKRINMGAYGGTSQASMSLSDAGNIADLNNNGWVDEYDLKLFTDKWLYEVYLIPADTNRDGKTNLEDFAFFANNWLLLGK